MMFSSVLRTASACLAMFWDLSPHAWNGENEMMGRASQKELLGHIDVYVMYEMAPTMNKISITKNHSHRSDFGLVV